MQGKIKSYRLYAIINNYDGSSTLYPVKHFSTLSGAKNCKALKDHFFTEFVIVTCSAFEGEAKYYFKNGIWTTDVPCYAQKYWARHYDL